MANKEHSTHSCWQSTSKTIRGTALRKNGHVLNRPAVAGLSPIEEPAGEAVAADSWCPETWETPSWPENIPPSPAAK
jgi:hypothetical protein